MVPSKREGWEGAVVDGDNIARIIEALERMLREGTIWTGIGALFAFAVALFLLFLAYSYLKEKYFQSETEKQVVVLHQTINRLADENAAWRRYFMRQAGLSDDELERLESSIGEQRNPPVTTRNV